MKTRAMDKAKTAVNDCLYPFKTLLVEQGYPSTEHFEVKQEAEGVAARVMARVAFESRMRIAQVSGYAVSERRPHTLQLSPRIHLFGLQECCNRPQNQQSYKWMRGDSCSVCGRRSPTA